jgi:hypothetical protein
MAVYLIKVLYQPGQAKEIRKNLSQGSWFEGRVSNPGLFNNKKEKKKVYLWKL